jgi:hypothetical protein
LGNTAGRRKRLSEDADASDDDEERVRAEMACSPAVELLESNIGIAANSI